MVVIIQSDGGFIGLHEVELDSYFSPSSGMPFLIVDLIN